MELGSSDDAVLVITSLVATALLLAGIVEQVRHRRNVAALPLRISVNGSRGKSTVTRLLTGALASGGYRPLGKTTGTQAQLIRGWSGEEIAVHRRPEGPNIGEQRQMMRTAVSDGADTVVAECMAVTPEYQRTFHQQLLDVNLLVITNALDDHLAEMGPTADDVAEVFAATIPEAGVVATVPGRYLDLYRRVARARGATLLVADPPAVEEELLTRFTHLVLAEHVALVLAVTRYLDVPDDVAVEGMLAAPADPFATRFLPVGRDEPALFINAFAANDPASTLAVWEHLRRRSQLSDPLTVIMNCREDRVERTRLFAEEVLPMLPIDRLVVMGVATRPVLDAAKRGDIPHRTLHDLSGASSEEIVNVLLDGRGAEVLLGVGNLHGGAVELIAALEKHAVRDAESDRTLGAA